MNDFFKKHHENFFRLFGVVEQYHQTRFVDVVAMEVFIQYFDAIYAALESETEPGVDYNRALEEVIKDEFGTYLYQKDRSDPSKKHLLLALARQRWSNPERDHYTASEVLAVNLWARMLGMDLLLEVKDIVTDTEERYIDAEDNYRRALERPVGLTISAEDYKCIIFEETVDALLAHMKNNPF